MSKRLQEVVKYTTQELESYIKTEGSCVRKDNTNFHMSLGPHCLADFKETLMAHIVRTKVGFYDMHLDGIVLDVKKVKVLGNTGALRTDDTKIHININADVYVFKPEEGARLTGVVKHIGVNHIGVILYRVFNANLRFPHKVDRDEIQMDQEVKFCIRKYNLQNVFPYIDGEILLADGSIPAIQAKRKAIKIEKDFHSGDSGIEEKEEGIDELDAFLKLIKQETLSETEDTPKTKKKSRKVDETPGNETKSRAKKRKSSVSESIIAIDEPVELPTPKKVKKEKKSKKEKSHKKKSKGSVSNAEELETIKLEDD